MIFFKYSNYHKHLDRIIMKYFSYTWIHTCKNAHRLRNWVSFYKFNIFVYCVRITLWLPSFATICLRCMYIYARCDIQNNRLMSLNVNINIFKCFYRHKHKHTYIRNTMFANKMQRFQRMNEQNSRYFIAK